MKMRLIDEDVLVRESLNILTWLMERQEQGISTTLGELHEKWIDAVRKAPTAYDLDKVVEQLEEERENVGFVKATTEASAYIRGINDAIKIVKGGGVDAF